MNKKKLVSIVVPIYNVEDYLDECINSLIKQTYREIEIILVDDGSTDNCLNICNKYEKEDERIFVIHKENGGLSDARNIGLTFAHGQYIFFVDSDDYILPNTIETVVNCAIKDNLDIVCIDFYSNEIQLKKKEDFEVKKDMATSILKLIFFESSWSVWGKLFKTSVIRDFKFKKGILYEDFEFIPKVFLNAENAAYINQKLYYYRLRKDSIMGTTRTKLNSCYMDIACQNINLFKNNELFDLQGCIYIHVIWNVCMQFDKKGTISNEEFEEKFIRFVNENKYKILKNKFIPIKYKIIYIMYILNPKQTGKIYYMLKGKRQ